MECFNLREYPSPKFKIGQTAYLPEPDCNGMTQRVKIVGMFPVYVGDSGSKYVWHYRVAVLGKPDAILDKTPITHDELVMSLILKNRFLGMVDDDRREAGMRIMEFVSEDQSRQQGDSDET